MRAVLGEVAWVQVIEDRGRNRTLLPREGREGRVHVTSDATSALVACHLLTRTGSGDERL